MNINNLLLQTAFACMSCDGDIAPDEVSLIKEMAQKNMFGPIDIDTEFASLVAEINQKGKRFLKEYITTLANAELTEAQEISVANVAVQTIRADKRIEYSEIKFFKIIRSHLKHVTDETLLAQIDGIDESYLAQDIKEDYLQLFDDYFDNIELPQYNLEDIIAKN